MKTHWLYGWGPNKEVHFKVEIEEETDCTKCMHVRVCYLANEYRCSNYEFADSRGISCDGCIHRFTRYDKEMIPCFHCVDFLAFGIQFKEEVNEDASKTKTN